MTDTPDAATHPAAATPWRRYLMIGLPIVAVAVAVVVIWWPKWEIQLAINGLHASDGRARGGHIETLKTHPDKELVIEELLDSVQDDGHSFGVRKICCGLLVDHFNRLPKLNPILRSGPLLSRGVILDTLAHKDYFETEYLEDPRYRVRETILEWLRVEGDMTRMHAIQLAAKIKMPEAMPDIRPLLRRSQRSNVHSREERDLMIAAAGAVERFKDCESTPVLLEVAEKDSDHLVRLRFMQILERTVFREKPPAPCPGQVDEARMQALVQKSLEDEDHRVRMGGMLILARHQAWAAGVAERLQGILDGGAKPAERRQALAALVALGQPAFLERFPQYFHAPSVEIRRTAARSVTMLEDHGFEGCWIGLLADETPESGVAIEEDARHGLFRDVLQYLRRRAKGYKGFPGMLVARANRDKVQFAKDMATLFLDGELAVSNPTDGTVERVTRAGLAEAWFRWWCADRGLDAERTEKAVAAWRACAAARRRGDVKAAEAALAALEFDAAGLYTYERAWIAVRSR